MFAELVCGPPGSGKSTYCEGKRQFISVYDPRRPVVTVNLDPANDGIFPYPCDVDVRMLISHDLAMEEEKLGPNGAYLFCVDFMANNVEWLEQEIAAAVERRLGEKVAECAAGGLGQCRPPYLLVDCPGQVEFYLNSDAMQRILAMIQKQLRCSVCVVHLADAVVATRDIPTYISTCLLSLSCMVDMELPHVNVMSKWDLVDAAEEDEKELFLRTSEFASDHFNRLWKKAYTATNKTGTGAVAVAGDDDRGDANSAARVATGGESSPEQRNDDESGATAGAAAPSPKHYTRSRNYALSHAVLDVVEGYGLVAFQRLDVQCEDHMLSLTRRIDNALGNLFA